MMKNSLNVFIQWVNKTKQKKKNISNLLSGVPRPHTQKIVNNWPCNPEKTLVS